MLRAEGGNKCAGRLCPAHWPPAARGHGDSGDSGLTAGLQSTVSTAAACLLSGGHWGLHPTLLGNKSIFYASSPPSARDQFEQGNQSHFMTSVNN